LENADEIVEKLVNSSTLTRANSEVSDAVDLYVCTQGARHCPCGEVGTQVVRLLHENIERMTVNEPQGLARRLRVSEVGHVGGHYK
jgi:hypothetical protein